MKVPAFFARVGQIVSSYKDQIKSDKRVYMPLVAFLVIVVALSGYFGYKQVSMRWDIPEVMGANFSLEYRKIPFDVTSLDIIFSSDMDPASVTSKSITLSPFIEGKASVKNGNIISYTLDRKLTIGEKYTLTIASSVASKYGISLGHDLIITFEAIAGAKATKILPSGHLDNL